TMKWGERVPVLMRVVIDVRYHGNRFLSAGSREVLPGCRTEFIPLEAAEERNELRFTIRIVLDPEFPRPDAKLLRCGQQQTCVRREGAWLGGRQGGHQGGGSSPSCRPRRPRDRPSCRGLCGRRPGG